MLYRFKKNVLKIGTTGAETPFLAEGELPEWLRLSGYSDASNYDVEDDKNKKNLKGH